MDYKYDAFISYRHTDEKKVKKIHSSLEKYRIPKYLEKKYGENRTGKIFRDMEELPASSDLGADIIDALSKSRFLIVVCSKSTKESVWVRKEIKTFIEMHGYHKILAIVLEGEPNEVYPEEIRFIKEYNKIVEIEPLAADLRSDTPFQFYHKFRIAKLKILAPLLGCSFDDLARRQRRRNIYKLVSFMLSTLLILCFFYVFYHIQTNELTKENRILESSITQSNIEIDQYQTLNKLDEAEKAILVGNTKKAEVIAAEINEIVAPSMEEYEKIMAKLNNIIMNSSLDTLNNSSTLITLESEATVVELVLNKNNVLIGEENGNISEWNLTTGKLIRYLPIARTGLLELSISSNGKYIVMVNDKNIIDVIDYESGSRMYYLELASEIDKSNCEILFSENGDTFCWGEYVIDTLTGERILFINTESNYNIQSVISRDGNFSYVVIDRFFYLYDLNNDKVEEIFSFEESIENFEINELENIVYLGTRNKFVVIDYNLNKVLLDSSSMINEDTDCSLTNVIDAQITKNGDVLYVMTDEKLISYNIENESGSAKTLVSSLVYKLCDNCEEVIVYNNQTSGFSLLDINSMEIKKEFVDFSSNILPQDTTMWSERISPIQQENVIVSAHGKYIKIWETDKKMPEIARVSLSPLLGDIKMLKFSPDQSYIVSLDEKNEFSIMDIDNQQIVYQINNYIDIEDYYIFENNKEIMAFTSDARIVFMNADSNTYNLTTIEEEFGFSFDVDNSTYNLVGNKIIVYDEKNLGIGNIGDSGEIGEVSIYSDVEEWYITNNCEYLLITGDYKNVDIININDGNIIELALEQFSSFWFSEDGQEIFIYLEGISEIKVINIEIGVLEEIIDINSIYTVDIVFSNDNDYFVIRDKGYAPTLWNRVTYEKVKELEFEDEFEENLMFSNDSKYITSWSENIPIIIWETSSGELIYNMFNPYVINGTSSTTLNGLLDPFIYKGFVITEDGDIFINYNNMTLYKIPFYDYYELVEILQESIN